MDFDTERCVVASTPVQYWAQADELKVYTTVWLLAALMKALILSRLC